MVTLNDADKSKILEAGGKPNKAWTLVSFNKNEKPKRNIKKLLRLHGYEITRMSGRKFEAIMVYELLE